MAEDIYRELARWQQQCVNPTHVLMSPDALAVLADEQAVSHWVGNEPMQVWGVSIIVANIDGWRVGSARLRDALEVLEKRDAAERMGRAIGG